MCNGELIEVPKTKPATPQASDELATQIVRAVEFQYEVVPEWLIEDLNARVAAGLSKAREHERERLLDEVRHRFMQNHTTSGGMRHLIHEDAIEDIEDFIAYQRTKEEE